jgi:hypothetical protein
MQNDEFNKEDIDDEKTIEYIRQRLPQDLKEKFSDDEFYYFLDTIYDYYDKSGIFESQSDPNGYIEIDIEAIAKYAVSIGVKEMHLLPYHPFGVDKYKGLGRNYLMAHIKTPTNEHMEMLLQTALQTGIKAQIGG